MSDQQDSDKHSQFNLDRLISFRRDMHKYPELSLVEYNTQKKIIEYLKSIGVDSSKIVICANTGLYVDILGEGDCINTSISSEQQLLIAARADIDALPLNEDTDLEFKSVNSNVMHACGHDGHTASLLGAISLYLENLETIPKNCGVRFIFQPGEEGHHGANIMVNEGIMDDVTEIYGCHNYPVKELEGKMIVRSGEMMAAFTIIDITIIGKGGHGSRPESCRSPVPIACQLYKKLDKFMEDTLKENPNCRGSIPLLKGSDAFNVIPEEAKIAGTFRNFDPKFAEEFIKRVEEIVIETCKAENYEYKMANIPSWHKPVINNEEQYKWLEKAAKNALGEDFVTQKGAPIYASEDFSEFTAKKPGCFWFAAHGINEEGVTLHNNKFKFDDNLIEPISKVWSKQFELRLNDN